jgi:hypothetical protein
MISWKRNVDKEYNVFLIERAKWESLNITAYQYTIKNISDGYVWIFDSTIYVKDREFYTEILNDESKKALEKSDEKYITIDNIYNYLEDRFIKYNNEKMNFLEGHCKNIRIKYDQNYSIPIKIEFNYYYFPFVKDTPSYYIIEIEEFNIIDK